MQQQLAERLGFLGLAESAVYKTLERLELDGCVESAGQKQIGRTARVLYRATPEGVLEFKRWLAEPSDPPPLREELHAKLVLAGPDDLPQLLEVVEGHTQACLDELAELGRRPRPSVPAFGPVPWSVRARLLVDDFAAYRLESLVDWLSEVAEAIQEQLGARPARSAGDGAAR